MCMHAIDEYFEVTILDYTNVRTIGYFIIISKTHLDF